MPGILLWILPTIGISARVMDELEKPGGGAQQYLGPNLSIFQKWVYINKKISKIIASKLNAFFKENLDAASLEKRCKFLR